MSSLLISGGPLLSVRCSARVRHCLRLLVWVVDWCVGQADSWSAASLLVPWTAGQAVQGGCWSTADRPLTWHLSPSLTTFAFRSSEVRRLLLDLDIYGGTDPLGMFPIFLKSTADVMAPRPSVVFQRLVRLGSFPACLRQANVTPIPKTPPSSSVANYRPISITSVLSKVFERLVSVRLGRFMEQTPLTNRRFSGVLPTTQFAYREGLGTCDAILCVSYTPQSALDSGQEVRIMQIDFSDSFDWVNHQGILYKPCSVGIECSVLTILTVSIEPITARYGGGLSE